MRIGLLVICLALCTLPGRALTLTGAPLSLALHSHSIGQGTVTYPLTCPRAGAYILSLEATLPWQLGPEPIRYTVALDGKPLLAPQGWDRGYQPYFAREGSGQWLTLTYLRPLDVAKGEHVLTITVPAPGRVRRLTLAPQCPATLSATFPGTGRVRFPDEPAEVRVRVAGLTGPASLRLLVQRLQLADPLPTSDWGPDTRVTPVETLVVRTVALKPGADGAVEVPLAIPRTRYGLLGVTALLQAGALRRADYLGAIAVVPRRAVDRQTPDGPFLSTVNLRADDQTLQALKRGGIDWVRTEIGWGSFEPERGRFRWEALDPFFARCRARGLVVMNLAAHAPRWAQPPGEFAPIPYKNYTVPLDGAPSREALPEWEAGWRAFFTRYRDLSPAINLWNEPWEGGGISGWQSTGAHYRALLSALARARTAVDPAIKIVAADSSHDTEWKLLAAGRAAEFDVISVHYETPKACTAFALARAYRKEVWDTESWLCWQGEGATARRILYSLALGATRVSLWTQPLLLDQTGAPTPALAGVAGLRALLDGVRFTRVLHPARPPFVLLFTGATRQVAAIQTTLAPNPRAPEGHFRSQFAGDRAVLEVDDPDGAYGIFDLYANPLPVSRTRGRLSLPIDAEPRFLVAPAGDAAFATRLAGARYRGGRPVEILLHDLPDRLTRRPTLQVTVRNAYPHPLTGIVTVTAEGLAVTNGHRRAITLPAEGQLDLHFPVSALEESPWNRYPVTVRVATDHGTAELAESVSVAAITREGPDAPPVACYLLPAEKVATPGTGQPPPVAGALPEGGARFALSRDDAHLYLKATVQDATPRMLPSILAGTTPHQFQTPPADYLYRAMAPWPERDGDALTLSLGPVHGKAWDPAHELFPPDDPLYRFGAYQPATHTYLIYPTGPASGELLRLRAPGFYYVHPLPMEYGWMATHCRVPGAQVTVQRDAAGYTLTAAIPWTELTPLAHAPGDRLRLDLRLRDATPGAPLSWAGSTEAASKSLQWAKGRSLSSLIPVDYTPVGRTQWAAETEWGVAE
jgi:hypothetical protein